jgi:hypothetical protein
MSNQDDEQRHLDAAAQRLSREFGDAFPAETVENTLQTAVSTWSDAPVRQFVPVLAERFTRDQLRALRHDDDERHSD